MPAPAMTPEQREFAVQVVDALNAIFGTHSGARAVHAKGIVCRGTFQPTAEARTVSRALHLQGGGVPVTVRFSDFAGIPTVPDGDPGASPRGMAIRFHLAADVATDIVAHSYDGFPVGTAPEFLAFLRAIAASGPGAPSPAPIQTFAAAHPATARFLEAPKPTPASFATEAFFAVNAFRFTNADGISAHGRYRILPVAGTAHLDAADAAARPPDFLMDELRARLAGGPAQFRVVLQVAADDDPVHDGSQVWPADRRQVELGILSVTEVVADSAAAERALIFDPTRLVDGIALSEDPLPLVRSQVYSISFARRNP